MFKKQGKKELIEKLNRKKNSCRFMNFPTDGKREFKILDYLIFRQSDYRYKYFIIEHIQPSWKKETELRFGYYILGKKGNVKGKWVWGQFAPLIPARDLKALLRKAEKRGFIRLA